ncbi:PREDICTED: uncharacterized protein LOC104784148 [Camelina sativa]|uniref:Uncharacterized protein LOC104784148 n=1 Tax=Camelina sativa TaxID=90675 RepID=A0ABM0YXM0_CAMSA|nr:PREDICTED: uncharacterized protein LOC104784148 [Camelina sativa]
MAAPNEVVVSSDESSLVNVNMSNVTKLTATKFLMWSRQIHALLDGYDVAGYLDGSILPLDATLTTADTYAKPSRTHIKQIRDQLTHWKKGSKSIEDYVQGFTIRFDQLALLESPIAHEDQIDYILGGLPEDYKRVINQIEGRDTTPTITEVNEKLINEELKLQSMVHSSSVPTTTNTVSYKPSGSHQQPRRNTRHGSRGQQHHFSRNDSRGMGHGYQGRCQLCGVFGHSARRCSQLPFGGGYPAYSGGSPQPPMQPWQPRANVAMAPPYNPANWIMDSGATHHLTSDLANLSMHQPYTGGEEVTIADGSGLPISQTGSALLPTPSRSLKLIDVLYVPNVCKNLISVYRLSNANNVSVHFYPAYFHVKDLKTGAQLLQGRTKNELYEWPVINNVITSFTTSPQPRTDLSSWHYRFGHPSLPVLKIIVSEFSLPFSSKTQQQFSCSDCFINKSHKLPFHSNTITSTRSLEYIYSDVWTSPLLSTENFKYYLVMVDHFIR